MSDQKPEPASAPPPLFQFRLRTLLLLFVVLGSSLAVFGAWGIVVFGLVVGLAIYIQRASAMPSRAQLVAIGIVLVLLMVLLIVPAIGAARDSRHPGECYCNLRAIALALVSYEQANGRFPPAYIADKNGKPTHSWRVLILPYLEQHALYKAYDFAEPWDGPKNGKLLASRPAVFCCPADSKAVAPAANQTSYVAVVGLDAAWAGAKPMKRCDFKGGVSHTVMVVETHNSGIAWTEPRDLPLDVMVSRDAKPAASSHSREYYWPDGSFFFTDERRSGINVALADGTASFLCTAGLSTYGLREILRMGACTPEKLNALHDWRPRHLNWPNIAALAVWLLSVGTLLVGAVRSRKGSSIPPTSPTS